MKSEFADWGIFGNFTAEFIGMTKFATKSY